jgi:hypothetical protein
VPKPQEQLYDDILKQAHRVEARANALSDELVRTLENVRFKLLAKLAELQEKRLTSDSWDAQPLTRRRAYLEAQREAVDELIDEVYAGMGSQVEDAAADTMAYAASAQETSLKTLFGIGGGATNVTVGMVTAWAASHTVDGLLLSEWLKTLGRGTADRIVAAGREALIMGYGTRKTATLLRAQGVEGSIAGLNNLARTFLMSASNYARDTAAERLVGDMLKGWQYVATLDGRTCPVCGADDNRFFPVDKPRPNLPRHFSCRCLYVPVVNEADAAAPVERPAVKHEERTVHHRDGSTSTKFKVSAVEHTTENYSQWLKRQLKEDPAFVRSILGKTRFELFQAGEIDLRKMVVDGRIKRLSELQK